MPMINLIVRGKDLMQGMADFAKACYGRTCRPNRALHHDMHALANGTRSRRERGHRWLKTPRAKSFALPGDIAGQPRERIAAAEPELAGSNPGQQGHQGASAASLLQEGHGRRGVLDERLHLRDALEILPIAMLAVDQKNQIVFANANALELFGYTGEELTGASIEMLFPMRV